MSGDEFRVGSQAPENPGKSRCDAPWPGPWEDTVQRRPRCGRVPGHEPPHSVEEAGFDHRCRRYTWTDEGDERVEPC